MAKRTKVAPKAKKAKTYPVDEAAYLDSEAAVATFLNAYFEDGPIDAPSIAHALGIAARARGMMQIARASGLSRSGLYKALAEDGNPSFETVAKIMEAMGVRLRVEQRPG